MERCRRRRQWYDVKQWRANGDTEWGGWVADNQNDNIKSVR
jgi:hypothetical protein